MLKITDLHKRFGDKEVLKGLDLYVPEHSIFGFIGKNGAGKTTTMKTVLGLVKPDAGDITVAGESVVYGQTATNRFIGYLPDVPEFYPFMNAREYLLFCGEITGMEKKEREKRADELLELVGLSGERHRVKGFSRGMKQRLGIAQALFNRPRLLICDEPTSALDPVGRKEILDILLAVRNQTTVLFSTHILSDVERICTDIAFIDGGKTRMSGKLADIRNSYRRDEYVFETETAQAAGKIAAAFPAAARAGDTSLTFSEKDINVYALMRFAADNEIPVVKLERIEPTLESLFMEVTGE